MHKLHHLIFLYLLTLSLLILSTNQVTCPSYKYYDTTSSTCLSCSYNCVQCTSSSDCTLCDGITDKR